MRASFVDLRTKSSEIIRALSRNERVNVVYRGKPVAVMHPVGRQGVGPGKTQAHPAFGLWRDRRHLANASAHVRSLRQGRYRDL